MPRQQAEELLEQERQHSRQEAEAEKEQARADGYRQGYGEGLRQARGGGRRPELQKSSGSSRPEVAAAFWSRPAAARE